MKYTFLILLLLIGSITACQKADVSPENTAEGQEYYPLVVGDFRVYNVTDIKFKNNVGDTSRYQMREVIDTFFTDQTNTATYKIIRSKRANEATAWEEDSVLLVTKSKNMLLLTQNNTKYVKLVFPVKESSEWQADAYNNRVVNPLEQNPLKRKEPSKYLNVGKPFAVAGKTFEHTVTVVQGTPTDNLVQLDDRQEVYARNIGRVFRKFNRIVYCNDSESIQCPFGVGYKLEGQELQEVLISYGHN